METFLFNYVEIINILNWNWNSANLNALTLSAFLWPAHVLHFAILYYFSFYLSRSSIYPTAGLVKQFRKVKSQKVTLISLWASISLGNATLKNNEGILAPFSSYIDNKGTIKTKFTDRAVERLLNDRVGVRHRRWRTTLRHRTGDGSTRYVSGFHWSGGRNSINTAFCIYGSREWW